MYEPSMALLGPRIEELPKSTLQAGLAKAGGPYPFFCSSPEVKTCDQWLLESPAILMGTGGVASVHLGHGQFAYSTDTWAFRPSCRRTNVRFLFRQLEQLRPKIDHLGFEGSGLRHLQKSFIRNLRLPLPDNDQQAKIVEVLDTFDAAIRGSEAMLAKLRAMKQGLLHDLLARGIDANGDLRPPQSEAPQLYQQTALGWLPKKWTTSKLPGLAKSNRPVIRTGPFGSSLKGEHWRGVGRPVITIGAFGENSFIVEELLFIDEKKALGMLEYEVQPGDLVFSRVADVGRSLVVSEDQEGWIMSSNLMRISVEPRKLLPNLLHAQLRHSARLRKQMSQLVNSAGRDVANSAVLLALDFVVPTPAEQEMINSAIDVNETALVNEETQLEKLRLQKFGLMDDLLTGRVPVTPLL